MQNYWTNSDVSAAYCPHEQFSTACTMWINQQFLPRITETSVIFIFIQDLKLYDQRGKNELFLKSYREYIMLYMCMAKNNFISSRVRRE